MERRSGGLRYTHYTMDDATLCIMLCNTSLGLWGLEALDDHPRFGAFTRLYGRKSALLAAGMVLGLEYPQTTKRIVED